MTSEQIEAIRNRASLTRYTEYPKFNKTANANLLINEDIPALLAEVERLQAKLTGAETLLSDAQDIMYDAYLACSETYVDISKYFGGDA